MADFIPKRDAPLYVWLTRLKEGLPDHAADFELTPERLAIVNGWTDALIAALGEVRQKKNEWRAASSLKKLQARTSLAGLRQEIARWKTAPGAQNGGLVALHLIGSLPAVDVKIVQPELSARLTGGQVRLRFKKRGASDVNLYMRRAGEADFRLLARVTRSPYLDETPVAKAGVAETRQYRAIGLRHDREIGLPSNDVSVTVPG